MPRFKQRLLLNSIQTGHTATVVTQGAAGTVELSNTFTASITFLGRTDTDGEWLALGLINLNTGARDATATAHGFWAIPPGIEHFCLNVASVGSGTVTADVDIEQADL